MRIHLCSRSICYSCRTILSSNCAFSPTAPERKGKVPRQQCALLRSQLQVALEAREQQQPRPREGVGAHLAAGISLGACLNGAVLVLDLLLQSQGRRVHACIIVYTVLYAKLYAELYHVWRVVL